MNRWVYASAGALMLVLLGGLILRAGSRPPAPPPGEDAPGPAGVVAGATQAAPWSVAPGASIADREWRQTQARLAQLETQIARLERQVQALQSQRQALADQSERSNGKEPPSSAAAGHDDPGDADSATDDDARATAQAAVQQRLTTLETEFSSQAPDPQWSSQAVNDLSQILNTDAFTGTTLANLACATTLCRLEVRHNDKNSRDRFMDEIFPALSWQTTGYSHTVTNNDGGLTTVLYLSREGYSLPPASK